MNAETTTKHTSIFDNKGQYLAFRANWKKLYSEGFQKRVKHEYRHGVYYYNAVTKTWEDGGSGYYMESPLTVFHHLVFNLALGRDPMKAFGGYRKAAWSKPMLYWKLIHSKADFSIFADVLTPLQIDEIEGRVKEFIKSL